MKTACLLRELRPGLDPLAVLEALRGDGFAWLLDSALVDGRLGRFSFAGSDPYAVLRSRGGCSELEVRRDVRPDLVPGRQRRQEPPLEALRALLPRAAGVGESGWPPFVGGAVGYFGYELLQRIEAVRLRALDDLGHPELYFLLVDRAVAFDHAEGRTFLCALGFGAGRREASRRARAGLAALGARLAAVPRGTRATSSPSPPVREAVLGLDPRALELGAHFDEAAYGKCVEQIREWILDGELYQANLTQRLTAPFASDPWRLYRCLRELTPAPFAAYLELPEVSVVGSSPERFLRVDAQRRVESRPIKGTRPRAMDPAVDRALARALATSGKDRAENLMIVDLVRNDLGRVCETGSIHVPELMVVEAYASVFQLVSTIRGRLRRDRDAVDLVRAAFPPGSMTGAPKLAAIAHIDRLEPVARGIYSGVLGYLDARGGADLCVVIRTILAAGGRAHLHVGGGIVADSDPRAEYLETLDKARALLAALAAAGPGVQPG